MTDYPDFQTPAAHAAQIAATGVPLLAKPAGLLSVNGQAILGGSEYQSAVIPLTQTGYNAYVNVSFPGAVTVPFVEVTLDWIDAAAAIIVAEEHYFLAGNTSGVGFVTFGEGIAKANQLQVTVQNMDPAQTATVALHVNQDSVPRLRDRWYWRNFLDNGSTVPGFIMPTLPDDENCLGVLPGVSIPASTTNFYLMGMAPGRVVQLAGHFSGVPAASVDIQVNATPPTPYTGSAWLLHVTPASLEVGYTFIAPRSPMKLGVQNLATTGPLVFNVAMFAQD